MQRLRGKVALVTGGASGLGKATAQRLSLEGAQVVITDLQERAGRATAEECGFDFMHHDVADEAQWRSVIGHVQERHGGLHVLVNNAGIAGARDAVSPADTRLSDWRAVFAVNVDGVFLGCRAAIPAIYSCGGGSIINIASIAGLMATPYATAYGASKAAVRQLTKSVAQHCAEKRLNIRCNSVHPGDVRTPLWDKEAAEVAGKRGLPLEDLVREWQAKIPLGEFTLSEDVAAAVAFLASDESRHVTGTKLVIDSGYVYCDTYRRAAVEAATTERS